MNTCPSCHHLNADDVKFCGECGTRVLAPTNHDTNEAAAAQQLPFAVGTTIAQGRYHLDAVLGQGGMGTVYRATDVSLGRVCALKVLNAELTAHPTARKRMEREARALARIEHPNVVQIRSVFVEGDLLAMELEYMSGGDLRGLIERGGLAPDRVISLMASILSGLQALHEAKLVHRDIKPENVLLDSRGEPKLTDLGVARDDAESGRTRTRLGAVLGTLEYMSPEQIQGLAVDARSDIYACGVMLVQMLTGELPFAAKSEFEWQLAHVQQEPDLTRARAVHASLADVAERALSKSMQDRWQDAESMAEAVRVAGNRHDAHAPATCLPASPQAATDERAHEVSLHVERGIGPVSGNSSDTEASLLRGSHTDGAVDDARLATAVDEGLVPAKSRKYGIFINVAVAVVAASIGAFAIRGSDSPATTAADRATPAKDEARSVEGGTSTAEGEANPPEGEAKPDQDEAKMLERAKGMLEDRDWSGKPGLALVPLARREGVKTLAAARIEEYLRAMIDAGGVVTLIPDDVVSSGREGSEIARAVRFSDIKPIPEKGEYHTKLVRNYSFMFARQIQAQYLLYGVLANSARGIELHLFLFDFKARKVAALQPVEFSSNLANMQMKILEAEGYVRAAVASFPADRVVSDVPEVYTRTGGPAPDPKPVVKAPVPPVRKPPEKKPPPPGELVID